MENILNRQEIELIIQSGKILKDSLNEVVDSIAPGISTLDLDRIAERAILKRGGLPSFKGYSSGSHPPFPASLCVSVNNEVVHGIPKADKILKNGDVVSLDLGVNFEGMHTDMAVTVGLGEITSEAKRLIDTTKKCLENAIKTVRVGAHIGDIGFIVSETAEAEGYGIIRDLVGHGVGSEAHLEPQIPNFGKKGTGVEIEEGMALAIEPMVTMGHFGVRTQADGWTIETTDGSLSAHFEHTIVLINGKPVVVTA